MGNELYEKLISALKKCEAPKEVLNAADLAWHENNGCSYGAEINQLYGVNNWLTERDQEDANIRLAVIKYLRCLKRALKELEADLVYDFPAELVYEVFA